MLFKGTISSMIIRGLFSFLFASMMALDRMIVTSDPETELFTDITQNYIGPVTPAAAIVFICSAVGMYALLSVAHWFILRRESKSPALSGTEDGSSSLVYPGTDLKLLLLFTVILGVCWLPYLLAHLPGGVFFDNFRIYHVIWGRDPLNNHQPILYTMLHALVLKITVFWLDKTMMVFVMTMTMIQYTVFAVSLAWFLCWLKKRLVSKKVLFIVLLFFCFFPLIPGYAISNWKDTLFSIFLFLFTITMADAALDGARRLTDKSWLIRFLVFGFLVCFFRNNGIFIVIICAALLVIRFRKEIFQKIRPAFLLIAVLLISGTLVVQEPVFHSMGFNDDRSMEMAGIPIQQISSIILSGGDVKEDELEFFDNIVKPEIRDVYFSPNGVSPMKRNISEKGIDFLRENQGEFIRVWLSVISRNPKQALDAFLLSTLGFWNANRGSSHGYVQMTLVPDYEYHGLTPRDLVHELTGFDLSGFLAPGFYFSAALFGWIALFCFVLLVMRKRYTLLLPFMPMLTLWGTVLVATPLAFSLRYVYALVLFVPLALYLAFKTYSAAAEEEPRS